jgi:restriction system protein
VAAKHIWAIRAGGTGQADAIFIQQNQVALSSLELDDDISKLAPSRAAFKDALGLGEAGRRPEALPMQAGQLYRFVHEVKIGDHIVYPRKTDRHIHWGEVCGPYVFQTDDPEGFGHRRGVRWIAKLPRDRFTPGALYELGAGLTLFEVKSFGDELLGRFIDQPSRVPAASSTSIA